MSSFGFAFNDDAVYAVRQELSAQLDVGHPPVDPLGTTTLRLSLLFQEILPKFRPQETHLRPHRCVQSMGGIPFRWNHIKTSSITAISMGVG